MNEIMRAIKYVEFLALELSVLAVIGAIVMGGLYQIVRDKVRESRRHDQIVPKAA